MFWLFEVITLLLSECETPLLQTASVDLLNVESSFKWRNWSQ